MQPEKQQAEYNARLEIIKRDANKKAAEEARREQLRQRLQASNASLPVSTCQFDVGWLLVGLSVSRSMWQMICCPRSCHFPCCTG